MEEAATNESGNNEADTILFSTNEGATNATATNNTDATATNNTNTTATNNTNKAATNNTNTTATNNTSEAATNNTNEGTTNNTNATATNNTNEATINEAETNAANTNQSSTNKTNGTETNEAVAKGSCARKTFHEGKRTVHGGETFRKLRLFYDNLKLQDRPVTVQVLTLELARMLGEGAPPLKTLYYRVYRWRLSENIVQRRVTHVAQNTRFEQSVIDNFVQYVNQQTVVGQYDPSRIVNIDETNIYFDLTSGSTLAERGTRTVSVRTTGSSARCTVLLGCTMAGGKLPPFIIFKGSSNGRIIREFASYPGGQYYTCQAKAWVDDDVFRDWVQRVWVPFCLYGGNSGENGGFNHVNGSYLIMDEFTVHLRSIATDTIRSVGTEIDYIPAGYTSKLQVLDLGVNKPFKGYVRREYERFMVTNASNKRPPRKEVAQWIKDAWDSITPATISNAWSSIGFVPFNNGT
jgi:hypothetical protein